MTPLRTLVLAATLALASLAFAPAVGAADVVRCVTLKDGSRVCVTVDGTCASAGYVPPFTDFGAGAGSCANAMAGPAGVTACEEAIAGYVTLGGFQGLWVEACAYEYEDAYGRSCLDATVESNQFVIADLKPACLALA